MEYSVTQSTFGSDDHELVIKKDTINTLNIKLIITSHEFTINSKMSYNFLQG